MLVDALDVELAGLADRDAEPRGRLVELVLVVLDPEHPEATGRLRHTAKGEATDAAQITT